MEKVLASKLLSDPLHALECPPLADGAVAFVMTSAENTRARGLNESVRIAGSGGCVSHYSIGQETALSTLGWPLAAERLYNQSGWGPEDADRAEVYDSYAVITAIGVEGLGLYPKGEARAGSRRAKAIPAASCR